MKICAVTVTYGNRFSHVKHLTDVLIEAGLSTIVIIDNASEQASQLKLVELAKHQAIHLIRHKQNLGTGTGFKAGIEAALRSPCDMLWLLDDDNIPQPDTLTKLKLYWEQHDRSNKNNKTALFCFRKAQFENKLLIFTNNKLNLLPPLNGFLFFHVDRVWMLIKGIFSSSNTYSSMTQQVVPLDAAWYGGLFFHRDLVNEIGLPDEKYHFYMDDLEYTQRILSQGGEVLLLPDCVINDMDTSVDFTKRKNLFYHIIFEFDSDLRAYYFVRNAAYFEHKYRLKNKLFSLFNRAILLSVLWLFSLLRSDFTRYKVMLRALKHARAGKMGK